MSLSREEVQHIARLARIGLTEDEEVRFQKDLAGVFGLIEELQSAKVKQEEIDLSHRETNRVREDKSQESGMEAEIIDSFPTRKDGFNKVRAVF
ncbi:Asp-tRNA(Asn)/Glu-tRNA(Gln) amidotransferase subunit GatC [Candidatus Dojkabacteria bacterium]|uniref:Asp-tRNA(Asn)/Glu-tRNA(Gln) amidotransferase subunit GatC n=1 Tax=Candidatus Dojkabacteria bacterium TaxID=2099670 RepID=A0A5C7JB17_9BACT|nr:MAG: Asp-tRNA(Asn)/Glu-tRNA(Gln) amidotransferase subunit GatC [Candidatus Dojkabacteria bacterium]